MQYDPARLGLPDLDAVRGAALYLPATAARELDVAVAELEAAREVIWHLMTLLGERGITEYGLPPWSEEPTIRGLLIPETAFLALDGLIGAYRRTCLAAPVMQAVPKPPADRPARFATPPAPRIAPLPRAAAAGMPSGNKSRSEPLAQAVAAK
jgi:hypothetical protein